MALACFPNISKRVVLEDGTGYAYVKVSASASKPTFLLLHGFPSFSYDWHHQITALAAGGFGIVAPDLLGYGDTDSPAEVEAYSLKRMSDHIAEILAQEGIDHVIGVGHDWGSVLLARFHTWYPQHLSALVFVSVGYVEPSAAPFDVDAVNEMTKKFFGYSIYGYWKWFNTDGAAKILDENPISATSIFYPADPLIWKEHLGPVGGAESWIVSGKTSPRPAWLTAENITLNTEVMKKHGYTGPLNWYKSIMRGIDIPYHATLSEDSKHVELPTLLVVSDQDYVTRADIQTEQTSKWIKRLEIVELSCGHWVQLELPNKLNDLLETFANKL